MNDEKAIKQHYEEIFKSIQQLALKAILKEWIKEIEPKKQKNFPYKKDILPDWWPRETKFTEPDHIKIVGSSNLESHSAENMLILGKQIVSMSDLVSSTGFRACPG